ncbi:MAG: hypothetical protein RSA17_00685 [Ruthenibacterium sp.]
MLGKLIGHEFRQSGRTFLPLFGGAAALLLLTKLLLVLNQVFTKVTPVAEGGEKTQQIVIMAVLSGIFAAVFVLALLALILATLLVSVQRFYKLLGDEGYSMFTLPVTPAQHIISKTIVALTWFVSAIVFAYVSGLVMLPADITGAMWGELAKMDGSLWQTLALLVACMLVGIVGALWTVDLSCAIGMHWPQQRLGASILVYFGLQMAMKILALIGAAGACILLFNTRLRHLLPSELTPNEMLPLLNIMLACMLVLLLIGSALLFFLTRRILDKKLNLA